MFGETQYMWEWTNPTRKGKETEGQPIHPTTFNVRGQSPICRYTRNGRSWWIRITTQRGHKSAAACSCIAYPTKAAPRQCWALIEFRASDKCKQFHRPAVPLFHVQGVAKQAKNRARREHTSNSRGAVEGRNGIAVVLGMREELEEIISSDDTGGDVARGNHCCCLLWLYWWMGRLVKNNIILCTSGTMRKNEEPVRRQINDVCCKQLACKDCMYY